MNLSVKQEGQIINPPAVILRGVSVTPGTTTVTATRFNSSQHVTRCTGATVPGAEAGFAKGCEFTKTGAANGTNPNYINVGDSTTANFQPVGPQYRTDSAPTKSTRNRIYTGSVTGILVVGETITQATSSATAVIRAKGTGYIDVDTVTGTFDATHLVTGGTSSATFTPTMTLLDLWTPTYPPVTPIVGAKSATAYTQIPMAVLLTTTKFRYNATTGHIETLTSDAISTFNLEYGA